MVVHRSATLAPFFRNEATGTESYTLSLHDALPIWSGSWLQLSQTRVVQIPECPWPPEECANSRSEEHTSELQSHSDLVCRLLLEKKKKWYAAISWRAQRAFGSSPRSRISARCGVVR